jgi:hypothetical protein
VAPPFALRGPPCLRNQARKAHFKKTLQFNWSNSPRT